MVHRFAVGGTFGHGALATSTTHTYTVDDVACLVKSTEFRYTDLRQNKNMRLKLQLQNIQVIKHLIDKTDQ